MDVADDDTPCPLPIPSRRLVDLLRNHHQPGGCAVPTSPGLGISIVPLAPGDGSIGIQGLYVSVHSHGARRSSVTTDHRPVPQRWPLATCASPTSRRQ